MDNFKQNIIKDIVQELDCGFDCYYNSKTGEIIGIPNFSKFINEQDFKAVFCDSLEKIENNKSDFIKFEALKSFESFRIMERFADQVADLKIKAELEYVLTNNSFNLSRKLVEQRYNIIIILQQPIMVHFLSIYLLYLALHHIKLQTP